MYVTKPFISRAAGGALFGLYMAFLLYFVNPQIESTFGKVATAAIVYATVGGLVFGGLLLAFYRLTYRFRPDEPGEQAHAGLTGFSVAATFAAGLVYWWNLTLLRIYLPRGAIRVLSKATLLLSAAAIVLLVLWLLERSAERAAVRRWARIGVLATVLLTASLLFYRRERYRPAADVNADVPRVAAASIEDLTVVAVRSLSYDWVMELRAEGVIPNIGQLVSDGFVARVEPFRSTSPKAVLASLATGKLPHRHGVTGRFSYRTLMNRSDKPYLLLPSGVGFRGWGLLPPVERISAQLPSGDAKAFWSILAEQGEPAYVIAWAGVTGSNPGGHPLQQISEQTPRMERERRIWAGRISLDRSVVRSDIPKAITTLVVDSLSRDLAAVAVLRETRTAAGTSAVMLQGFDRLLQALEPGVALPAASTPPGALIRAYLRILDRELGFVSHRRGATLAIVSPSSHLPPELPVSPSGLNRSLFGAGEGEGDGIVAVGGRNVRPHTLTTPVEVVDIVPTLLFALRLPVARDMDGRVLTEAFDRTLLRERGVVMVQTFE